MLVSTAGGQHAYEENDEVPCEEVNSRCVCTIPMLRGGVLKEGLASSQQPPGLSSPHHTVQAGGRKPSPQRRRRRGGVCERSEEERKVFLKTLKDYVILQNMTG